MPYLTYLNGRGCGCAECDVTRAGLGGIFSTLLNIVGAPLGVPVGSIAASQAQPGYAPVTQSADQVATTINSKVLAALKSPASAPAKPDATTIAVSNYALASTAQQLAAGGYVFPPGSVGAELTKPSLFDAFGAQNRGLVEIAAVVGGGLLILKALRGRK